ncbi:MULTISPECIES: MotE family protein [Rhizobium]|uniref:MotE family protein n=2 Tax=Rhizobium TaxID=379 RepID=A0ABY8IIJ8_9HYPH|nr:MULTISPECIES: MotE family protein [Rhizobium]MBZ5773234.1 MotE family protein [Rhizobium sp. VS19-DRK62.2]MBZ5760383.1 MotE family protein [Rhizobium sp. VS19-DR96]MBZ5766773.1 MotE family protein [Rhizobium sp. VS19-DR129.2]MBZ5784218.1 MotE family protein [Rhizobium sp. VS19-DR121]MBZ5802578.1 MotE family protein [Rhizobium sp. VS19-DR181]
MMGRDVLVHLRANCKTVALAAVGAALLIIPGAFAEDTAKPAVDPSSSQDEIRQFCTNIAEPARDQRYLLQKQALEKLQADVDVRIAIMDQRKAEYEDWLKRRNDFLAKADDGLVQIYKNMKPDAAAASLNDVKITIASAIIMKLKPSQASLILSEMDPQKAATVTNIMSSASDPNTSKAKDTQ